MKKMKAKTPCIKTKRLVLYPLSDAEIQELIDSCSDADLAAAYTQMLEGCKSNPEARIWYAPWTMEKKEGKIRIGDLGFKGPAEDDSVEIGYGINKEYEGQGYTTEAVKAAIAWAFDQDVLFVEAEAEESNGASIHILEKLGFTKYGQGEEGPRFVCTKPDTSYTSLGMCCGLCLGMSIGLSVFDNMTIGMSIGLALGVALGAAKDKQEKAKMNKIKKARYGVLNDKEE